MHPVSKKIGRKTYIIYRRSITGLLIPVLRIRTATNYQGHKRRRIVRQLGGDSLRRQQ